MFSFIFGNSNKAKEEENARKMLLEMKKLDTMRDSVQFQANAEVEIVKVKSIHNEKMTKIRNQAEQRLQEYLAEEQRLQNALQRLRLDSEQNKEKAKQALEERKMQFQAQMESLKREYKKEIKICFKKMELEANKADSENKKEILALMAAFTRDFSIERHAFLKELTPMLMKGIETEKKSTHQRLAHITQAHSRSYQINATFSLGALFSCLMMYLYLYHNPPIAAYPDDNSYSDTLIRSSVYFLPAIMLIVFLLAIRDMTNKVSAVMPAEKDRQDNEIQQIAQLMISSSNVSSEIFAITNTINATQLAIEGPVHFANASHSRLFTLPLPQIDCPKPVNTMKYRSDNVD